MKMRDSAYCREQAEMHLLFANQMSDPESAEVFRRCAERLLAEAVELEASAKKGPDHFRFRKVG
jgi:hypothetical protein